MANDAQLSPLLTIKDVATFTRCSDSTVRRAVRHGHLRAFSMPGGLRFRQEDVDCWVDGFAVQPVEALRQTLSNKLAEVAG
jgi:excisionase family DNA binding protein